MNQTEQETGEEKDRRELKEAYALTCKAHVTPAYVTLSERLRQENVQFPEGVGEYRIKFGYTEYPDPKANQPRQNLPQRLGTYLQERKDKKDGIVHCGDHRQYLIPMTGDCRLDASYGIYVCAVSPADAISHFVQTLSEVIDTQYVKYRKEREELPEMAIWAQYCK